MASKKDIQHLKASIAQINTAISDIRDTYIKSLVEDNKNLKSRVRELEIACSKFSIPETLKHCHIGNTKRHKRCGIQRH